MQPQYVRWSQRYVTFAQHQRLPLRTLGKVVLVDALPAGVGKKQRTLEGSVDVGEIGRVGIDGCTRQRSGGGSWHGTTK